jgi:hypothetical protein
MKSIVSLILLGFTHAKLKIMSPESLASKFKGIYTILTFLDGEIKASYANFGYIPYGQTIMGKLHYDSLNALACNEFSEKD